MSNVKNIKKELKLNYLKKTFKYNKDLLESIESILNNENLSEQKIIDILILLNNGLSYIKSSKNLEFIFNLHQKILIKTKITNEVNKEIFVNFLNMYINLKNKKNNKKKFERKLLLLIEYYLMIEQEIILHQQIEFIIYIINELINSHKNSSVFQFGFLYMKISEILNKRKMYYLFSKELSEIKKQIQNNIPNDNKGKQLNFLLKESN